jgi:hypothetical protein
MNDAEENMPEIKDPTQSPEPDRQPSAQTAGSAASQATGTASRASQDDKLPPAVTISFQQREPSTRDTKEVWDAIRLHTQQIEFNEFADFVERALCVGRPSSEKNAIDQLGRGELSLDRFGREDCKELYPFGGYIPGVDLYALLKLASEIFLLLRCGICKVPGSVNDPPPSSGSALGDRFGIASSAALDPTEMTRLESVLTSFLGNDRGSYVRAIIRSVFRDAGFKVSPFCPVSIGMGPCLLELIWTYWHEEAMLVQTANAIALRFQNVSRNARDPLAEFELDTLRPLSGFLWGYIQDEPSRLSVARRAYEYHHHYGFGLAGRAAARVRPADSRSKFLQGFHDLLRLTDLFYRDGIDNTVTPDPFPLLVALRDLHLILAQGAHNQFRDLPWTARSEMLVQQWLLARQETRDFLRGRLMVPYPEPWMGAVDAMKRLQGWSDTNVLHFHELAKFGERILLSVRHVTWDRIADPVAAQDWALSWKPEVQGYIHAYRMVTGVALSDDVVEVSRPGSPRYAAPAVLLRNRLVEQRRGALPSGDGSSPPALPARVQSWRRES